MGIFSKKKDAAPVSTGPELQVPDELAAEAAVQYGNANFTGALETYGRAIDKIHTMCVMAAPGSRIRVPGAQDDAILEGFVNSLGAALAMESNAPVGGTAEQAMGLLRQIAAEAGSEARRYEEAIASIARTSGLS